MSIGLEPSGKSVLLFLTPTAVRVKKINSGASILLTGGSFAHTILLSEFDFIIFFSTRASMKNLFRIFVLLTLFNFISSSAAAQTKPSETVRQAGEAMRRGDAAGARAILDKAIEKKKDLFEAYRMRSSVRSFGGDLDGAIVDLSHAIDIKPDAAELYQQRARFRMFRRDATGALKDFDQAIAYGLKSEKVYAGRGDLKRDAGDFDGAIADYQTAIGINPDYVQAYSDWSFALDRQGDADGAIVRLEEFLDRSERDGKMPRVKIDNPNVVGVLIKRDGEDTDGKQVFMQGQGGYRISAASPEEMQKKMEAVERNHNLAGAFGSLGRLYERKDNFDKALLNYGKALSIKKDDGYLRATRGKLRLKMNDVKGAVEDLSAAAAAPTGAPDRDADKGILLVLQGKDDEAQKEFDKYLQIFPNHKEFLNKRIEDARQKRQQR